MSKYFEMVSRLHPAQSTALVHIETMYDDNATTAAVEFVGTDGALVFKSGSAKRERFDARNRALGEKLATARALQKVVWELESQANAEVEASIPAASDRRVRHVLSELDYQATFLDAHSPVSLSDLEDTPLGIKGGKITLTRKGKSKKSKKK